jgi:uncharacterized cupredoxin-like copper-binding protein
MMRSIARDRRGHLLRRLLVVFVAGLVAVGGAASGFSFAGEASPKATGVTTNITVRMGEYYFDVSQTTAPVGTVVFTVINDGDVEHDFAIGGKTTPLMRHGEVATLTVNFSDARNYQYICTVGEHAIYGMAGFLTVTAPPATTTADTTTTTTSPTTTVTPPPPPVKPVAIVRVTATEFKFTLVGTKNKAVKKYKKVRVKGKLMRKLVKVTTTRTVRHGTVRFIVTNKGGIAHDFRIAGDQTYVLARGKRQVLDVKLAKGKYTYICTIRGHAAAGMKGKLVVT